MAPALPVHGVARLALSVAVAVVGAALKGAVLAIPTWKTICQKTCTKAKELFASTYRRKYVCTQARRSTCCVTGIELYAMHSLRETLCQTFFGASFSCQIIKWGYITGLTATTYFSTYILHNLFFKRLTAESSWQSFHRVNALLLSLTVGAETGAVGADPVRLAPRVAEPHVAQLAVPARGACAVTGLASTVRTTIQVAAL